MYQILIQIGPVTVLSLWIFLAIGLLCALLVLNKLIKKNRLKVQFIADHSLTIFFGGLILSRVLYCLRNFDYYLSELSLSSVFQFFYVLDKGLSPWGAIIGIIGTTLFLAHKTGENKLRWLDVILVSTLTVMTFGHVGAFLDGKNFGRETDLPWGVIIENSLYAVPIHPVQLYSAFYCLMLTIVLTKFFSITRINKEAGNISIIALTSYSFLRFFEEFVRGDESNIFFGMREAQIYALLGFIIGAILLQSRYKNNQLWKQ